MSWQSGNPGSRNTRGITGRTSTKRVFVNSMVAHVWAQQTQDEGRSSNGNFWFEGTTLYSYSTPIANVVATPTGSRAYLISSITYSPSTGGQIRDADGSAVGPLKFHVPYLGNDIGGGRYDHPPLDHGLRVDFHVANLAHLVGRYAKLKASTMRRKDLEWTVSTHGDGYYLRTSAQNADRYAETFGLDHTPLMPSFASDLEAIRAHLAKRLAERNTPAYLAKQAAKHAAKLAREAEATRIARLSYDERMAEWLAGANVRPPYNYNAHGFNFVALRIKGDTLETSLGATVPLAHAIKVFHAVAQCRATGTTWQRNGHTLHVGQFQVDRIEASGDFDAGCHHITWAECERVAKLAGVFADVDTASVEA